MIAGGQSLGPLLNLRLASPSMLVDVNGLDGLAGARRDDGWLSIGALTRQRDAEQSDLLRAAAPLLVESIPWIGHVAIRNRGTIGGSLAHGDPAAELPAVAVALGAEVVAESVRGTRTVAAAELFVLPLVTSLAPDELLTAVRIPAAPARSGFAWAELARRHGDFALAGVAVALTVSPDGAIDHATVVLAGMGPTPVEASPAAAVLTEGAPGDATFAEAAAAAADACDPASDIHASAGYRRRLARVLVRRAIEIAYGRACAG